MKPLNFVSIFTALFCLLAAQETFEGLASAFKDDSSANLPRVHASAAEPQHANHMNDDMTAIGETFTVTVKDVGAEKIALDLDDAKVWGKAPKTIATLEKQNVVKPTGGGAITKIQIQAAHNDTVIAFLLQWEDPIANWERVEKFADAAAVQFPSDGKGEGSSFMGDEYHMVNIWQWRADRQRDTQLGYQDTRGMNPGLFSSYTSLDAVDYPAEAVGNPAALRSPTSPVAAYFARSFGTLTYSQRQDISGIGEHKNGTWRVIFVRALQTGVEGEPQFQKGVNNFTAFAVWEGSQRERNGMKSFTKNWVNLIIE